MTTQQRHCTSKQFTIIVYDIYIRLRGFVRILGSRVGQVHKLLFATCCSCYNLPIVVEIAFKPLYSHRLVATESLWFFHKMSWKSLLATLVLGSCFLQNYSKSDCHAHIRASTAEAPEWSVITLAGATESLLVYSTRYPGNASYYSKLILGALFWQDYGKPDL